MPGCIAVAPDSPTALALSCSCFIALALVTGAAKAGRTRRPGQPQPMNYNKVRPCSKVEWINGGACAEGPQNGTTRILAEGNAQKH